jgi:hypothetical protein
VALRLTATVIGEVPTPLGTVARMNGGPPLGTARNSYFGPAHGSILTPVISRSALTAEPSPGPINIEEYEGTVVVPPGDSARLDAWGNIEIEVDLRNR